VPIRVVSFLKLVFTAVAMVPYGAHLASLPILGRPLIARLTLQTARVALHQARERLIRTDQASIIAGRSHRGGQVYFFSELWALM
jgi:hypothetical protein